MKRSKHYHPLVLRVIRPDGTEFRTAHLLNFGEGQIQNGWFRSLESKGRSPDFQFILNGEVFAWRTFESGDEIKFVLKNDTGFFATRFSEKEIERMAILKGFV